jgi:thiol:disulfide interchange protein DsbD
MKLFQMPTKWLNLVYLFLLMMFAGAVSAESSLQSFKGFGDPEFLEVDQAFQLSSVTEGDDVIVRWQIAPGYYLYKHRLLFSSQSDTHPDKTLVIALPKGQQKYDEYFGDVETYYDELEVIVRKTSANVGLLVQYQGCADAGLCYPPQKRKIGL